MSESNDFRKLIIISAPSRAGKSTIMGYLLESLPEYLDFSIQSKNQLDYTSVCDPNMADCVTWYGCLTGYALAENIIDVISVVVTSQEGMFLFAP